MRFSLCSISLPVILWCSRSISNCLEEYVLVTFNFSWRRSKKIEWCCFCVIPLSSVRWLDIFAWDGHHPVPVTWPTWTRRLDRNGRSLRSSSPMQLCWSPRTQPTRTVRRVSFLEFFFCGLRKDCYYYYLLFIYWKLLVKYCWVMYFPQDTVAYLFVEELIFLFIKESYYIYMDRYE